MRQYGKNDLRNLFVRVRNEYNGLAFRRLLVMPLSRRSGSKLWSNELLARTCLLKNLAVNKILAFRAVCRCQRQSMKSGNRRRGRRYELRVSARIRAGQTRVPDLLIDVVLD